MLPSRSTPRWSAWGREEKPGHPGFSFYLQRGGERPTLSVEERLSHGSSGREKHRRGEAWGIREMTPGIINRG